MALNDSEVNKQIQHMVAFIEQEAAEKANEINVKAEEEFNIEKIRLVQQEKLKISEAYEKKEKLVDVQKKILYSNQLNASRLQVLESRDSHVNKCINDSLGQLKKGTQDPNQYKKMLNGLIQQCLFQLMEPRVILKCRKADVSLVESAAPEAVKAYTNATNKQCQITIQKDSFLPEDCTGGVECFSVDGKISCNNTLEARLHQVAQAAMPQIRKTLFNEQ
eukprot:Nk52_evm66s230 gene=Nk52_evmTU66s230